MFLQSKCEIPVLINYVIKYIFKSSKKFYLNSIPISLKKLPCYFEIISIYSTGKFKHSMGFKIFHSIVIFVGTFVNTSPDR